MSVNGITSSQPSAYTYSSASTKAAESTAETTATAKTSESAAVYEASSTPAADPTKKTYSRDTATVNQLKADAEARTANMQSLVHKLLSKQATTYGNATDIWSFLKDGNYTVDPETKAQAQKDISEDGYWGVKQTSDRIVQFATALTGGDPDKIDEMMNAFKKGFAKAEKAWGGKLPDISQQTYDAVIDKFNKLKEQNGIEA